jgi:hypothetical protein
MGVIFFFGKETKELSKSQSKREERGFRTIGVDEEGKGDGNEVEVRFLAAPSRLGSLRWALQLSWEFLLINSSIVFSFSVVNAKKSEKNNEKIEIKK